MRIHFVVLKYYQYIRERRSQRKILKILLHKKINIIGDRNKKSMRIKIFTNKELRKKMMENMRNKERWKNVI